jgi:hypothetical protein
MVCGRSDDHLQALAPFDLHHQLHHSRVCGRPAVRGCTADVASGRAGAPSGMCTVHPVPRAIRPMRAAPSLRLSQYEFRSGDAYY